MSNGRATGFGGETPAAESASTDEIEVSTTVERTADVTLVSVTLANRAPVDRRIAVHNELDGPVMPPRQEGIPEAGWSESGFEGTVDAGGSIALGYSCPAPPAEPPVRVEVLGRAGEASESTTPADVVQRLGRAAPPGDALPDATASATNGGRRRDHDARESAGVAVGDASGAEREQSVGPALSTEADSAATKGEPTPTEADSTATGVEPKSIERATTPTRVDDAPRERPVGRDALPVLDAWFAGIETRLDRATALDGSLSEATAELREVGGLDGATELRHDLAADARRLRRVAARAEALSERVDKTEVPLAALEELS